MLIAPGHRLNDYTHHTIIVRVGNEPSGLGATRPTCTSITTNLNI